MSRQETSTSWEHGLDIRRPGRGVIAHHSGWWPGKHWAESRAAFVASLPEFFRQVVDVLRSTAEGSVLSRGLSAFDEQCLQECRARVTAPGTSVVSARTGRMLVERDELLGEIRTYVQIDSREDHHSVAAEGAGAQARGGEGADPDTGTASGAPSTSPVGTERRRPVTGDGETPLGVLIDDAVVRLWRRSRVQRRCRAPRIFAEYYGFFRHHRTPRFTACRLSVILAWSIIRA